MIVSIIIFFIIFGVLVISHEGGHFLIAKANGIRVNEFTIGMGPALFKTKKGDTEYSIRLLPFGGACIFDGMDGLEDDKEEETQEYDEHSFRNAKLAYDAARTGGSMPTVFNAANEMAVKMFLQEKIKFLEIYDMISEAMAHHKVVLNPSVDEILIAESETYDYLGSKEW